MITTIKVAPDVRDRLKRQAESADRTLGQHLAHLADLADREERFDRLREARARTTADEWESYRDETAAWDGLSGD